MPSETQVRSVDGNLIRTDEPNAKLRCCNEQRAQLQLETNHQSLNSSSTRGCTCTDGNDAKATAFGQ